jgi:hypothetical protein
LASFGKWLCAAEFPAAGADGRGDWGSADGFAAEGDSELVFFGLEVKIGFIG